MWSECEAEKGSCEVGTVQKNLETKKAEGKEYINLFADRCEGQNQNCMMIIVLSNALSALKLKKIELTFLVPGHSQNENNTAHSVIGPHYQNRFIYPPSQWESTIQQAFKTNFCQV